MTQKFLATLRSQLQETSRRGGWSASQFSIWWSVHKNLRPRAIEKAFSESPLAQDNPDIYNHLRPLLRVTEPHLAEISVVMEKYTNRRIGNYNDPSSYEEIRSQMVEDLIPIIKIPAAVDVLVTKFFSYSINNGVA